MIEWIDIGWHYPLLMAIMHSFWQGLIIISLISIITKTFRIELPSHLYLVNVVGLISLFLCFVITFQIHNNSLPEILVVDNSSALNSNLKNDSLSGSNSSLFTIESIVSIIWVVGALGFLIRFALSGRLVYKIKKRSFEVSQEWQDRFNFLKKQMCCNENVKLHYSTSIIVPMVIGVFKPVIVFPLIYFNQMTIQELESILIHEIAHIKRKDFLFNIVQHLIESFIFFNPATWWLSRQIHLYREYCCDDEVQEKLKTKKSYLSALYKVACHTSEYHTASISLINNKSEFTMRIKRMLNNTKEDSYYRPIASAVTLSMIVFVFFSFQFKSSKESTLIYPEETIENSLLDLSDIDQHSHEISTMKVNKGITVVKTEQPESNNILKKFNQVDINNLLEEETIAAILSDTIPATPRIQELEMLLEQKSVELNELSERLSEEMEMSIEKEVAELEALAQQLEEIIEPKMEALEMKMNEEEIKRIEEVGELLENKMELKLEALENKMENEVMKDLENSMEVLADEMERLHEKTRTEENKKAIEKNKLKMEEIHKKMELEMEEVHKAHSELMNDPEIKALREEMETLSKKIHDNHSSHEDIWTEETKTLQSEMENLQKEIEVKVNTMNENLADQIKVKAMEVEKIAKELHEEREKLKTKN